MITLLKLAWRNIWRNRRRSLITMAAVWFSVVLIAFANSVQNGTYEAMERHAVRLFTGELQVHRTGYQDERTFSYALEESEQDWTALITEYPWTEAYTRRLTGYGLISSDSSSTGGLILGVEPEREPTVSRFLDNIVDGRGLTGTDDHAVLMGETMAQNLSLQPGDTVVVLTQGYRNEMGADLYRLVGLLQTGSADIDRTTMVMSFDDAQALFSMQGRFTELVIRAEDFQAAALYTTTLRRQLDSETYEVMPWQDLMPELQQARAFDDTGNNIFYFFMLLLLGFEIFNTTTMSVMERIREFGVMQSIGMKPSQISLLVAFELTIKVGIALMLGLLTILTLALTFENQSIPLSENLIEIYKDFGFTIEAITFSIRPTVFIRPMIWVAVLSLIAMLYPVLKVQRYTPVEALQRA